MTRSIYRIHHQTGGFGCTSELGIHFQPYTKTVNVGESFQASIIFTSCGGAKTVAHNSIWISDNPNIATVIPKTGVITAIAPGETFVKPTNEMLLVGPASPIKTKVIVVE